VLYLCTHNSARSQMVEGLLRSMAEDRVEVFSAGTEATHVRPEAISVMAEIGVDISAQESETLRRYLGEPLDLIVTVCDDAKDACPFFAERESAFSGSSLTRHMPKREGDSRRFGRCAMRYRLGY
jgi:arsenate reductase